MIIHEPRKGFDAHAEIVGSVLSFEEEGDNHTYAAPMRLRPRGTKASRAATSASVGSGVVIAL